MTEWISLNSDLFSGLAGLFALLGLTGSALFKFGIPALRKRSASAVATDDGFAAATIKPLSAVTRGPASIAVMPFDSLSTDPDDAYLADGISCELISALSRAGYLQIAPRADCFALRDTPMAVREVGQKLGVRYVVTGSVRSIDTKLRVIAEFAEAATGRALWSKTYNREIAGVLAVQEDIAQSVASVLGGEAFRAEVIHLSPSTGSLDAWSLTQKSRHDYMVASSPPEIKAAVKLARKATKLDPDYALAHALLASLLMDLVSTASADDGEGSRSEARESIERALVLAGNQSEILMYAGRVWIELGERLKSVQALRRGTEISPFDFIEWGFLARSLAFGTRDEASESYNITERIITIAPEHPCVWTWQLFQGLACMNLERYIEASSLFKKVVETSPNFVRGWMCLASALGACDQLPAVHTAVARAAQINAAFNPERFAAYIGILTGDPDTALRLKFGLIKAGVLLD